MQHSQICKSQGKTSTCAVCGPATGKIKQQEREIRADPLVRDQESITIVQVAEIPRIMLDESEKLEQQQLQEVKLQGLLESLELQEQRERLHEQSRYMKANFPQARRLQQQQQILLQQPQKRCQQQPLLLRQVIQTPPKDGGHTGVDHLRVQSLLFRSGQPVSPLPEVLAACKSAEAQQTRGNYRRKCDETGKVLSKYSMLEEPIKAQKRSSNQSPTSASKKSRSLYNEALVTGIAVRQFSSTNDDGSSIIQPDSLQYKSFLTNGAIEKHLKSLNKAFKHTEKSRSMPTEAVISDIAAWKSSSPKDVDSSFVQLDSPQSMSQRNMSLCSVITKDGIEMYLELLNNKAIKLTSLTVTHKCLPVIQELIDDHFGWVYHDAVDPVALGLPDYFDVVETPMHLELIKQKLENAIYSDMSTFSRDVVTLVFENAILYNGIKSEVGLALLAQTMLVEFDKLYAILMQGMFTPGCVDRAKDLDNLESNVFSCRLLLPVGTEIDISPSSSMCSYCSMAS